MDERSMRMWRDDRPWLLPEHVRQDLALSRALVEIYNDPLLQQSLAFRGGTALQKLFYQFPNAPRRHSEDLDFVQIPSEGIGPVLDRIQKLLNPWLGKASYKMGENIITLKYKYKSPDSPLDTFRLKVEINSREHIHKLPLQRKQYGITTPWFTSEAEVVTYAIEELLGTKLRALYQRKKGRDLYDLARAMEYLDVDIDQVIACFQYYMRYPKENKVTRLEFEKNMLAKSKELSFRGDISALLVKGGDMNFERDFAAVMEKIISKLP